MDRDYRRFIAEYSHIAKPLTRLTEKNYKFNWTHECSEAFEKLKQQLTTAPVLAHPDFSTTFGDYIWWQRLDDDNCQNGVALPM